MNKTMNRIFCYVLIYSSIGLFIYGTSLIMYKVYLNFFDPFEESAYLPFFLKFIFFKYGAFIIFPIVISLISTLYLKKTK